MATQKETVAFILEKLRESERFSTRAMFGEYALYVDGKVVGLICGDQLYVKILPASSDLEAVCEKGEPYPGAKPYYLVEESMVVRMVGLSDILIAVADSLPVKKVKKTNA